MYTHFTVHGIQMDSILSNEHCIRDFIKNVLLSKQESTVKGAKVSPNFIPKFFKAHRLLYISVNFIQDDFKFCPWIGPKQNIFEPKSLTRSYQKRRPNLSLILLTGKLVTFYGRHRLLLNSVGLLFLFFAVIYPKFHRFQTIRFF